MLSKFVFIILKKFHVVNPTVFAEYGRLHLLAAPNWSSPLWLVRVSRCWAKKKFHLNHWIKFLDVVLEKPRQSYYRSYSISIGRKNKNNDSITGDRNPDPCTRILDHWADSANKTFLTESITLNVAKVKFDISF